MCDEMRYPPIYESQATKAFRQQYLQTQNSLRENGIDFQRHYAASVACSPSRASMYTGHYPSLHGVTQTTGAAKESFDPDVFWLDPSSVPTFGDYFRVAGYQTFWRGKWHASDADMLIPGTHEQLISYDPTTGAPDSATEALYRAADRLGHLGFSGWIGPEPHGRSPLNSGSSAANAQGRDAGFAQQAKSLIEQLNADRRVRPWFIVSSFVNPHDITLWGLWANLGFVGDFKFDIEEGVVPKDLFDPALFQQTVEDNLATKPSAQASYQQTYARWMQPILNDPATRQRYSRYYYQLHKNVDEQMMIVFQALLNSRFRDNTFVIFTSDHGGGPKVWKYSRYFDNPQFWSTPGTPGDPNVDVEDAILEQKEPTPSTDGTSPIACQITVKHTPKPDEFEMYNVSDDPMELNNLYNAQSPSPEQITLAQLLEQQCAQKRLRPISGQVPGQPTCAP